MIAACLLAARNDARRNVMARNAMSCTCQRPESLPAGFSNAADHLKVACHRNVLPGIIGGVQLRCGGNETAVPGLNRDWFDEPRIHTKALYPVIDVPAHQALDIMIGI